MPQTVQTVTFTKMVQNTINKAMTKKSPPVNTAAWMVLKRKYKLSENDGIWGGSQAAHDLGWRGYSDDVDLKTDILSAIVEACKIRVKVDTVLT